jgi:hypothetical protein
LVKTYTDETFRNWLIMIWLVRFDNLFS